jgi:hypothetical protein
MKQQRTTQGKDQFCGTVLIESSGMKLGLRFCWGRSGHENTREKKLGEWKRDIMKILLLLVRYSVPVIVWWMTQ